LNIETIKDIENLLYDYTSIPKEIQKYNTELNDAINCKEELNNTMKANTITDMPKGHDNTYDAIMETILRYDKHISYLSEKIKYLMDQKEFTEKLLVCLEPEEKRIIELRYFQTNCWYVVSMKAHYAESWCKELNKRALIRMLCYTKNKTKQDETCVNI
jgi:hypothetical protein